MSNKASAALILSSFALAATAATFILPLTYENDEITWPEQGTWSCHSEFNDKSISFDTEAEDTAIIVGSADTRLVGTDIETGRKFTILENDGWVCTLPSGTEIPMESPSEPRP